MNIRSIEQIKSLAGKKILLRADFNVPIDQGRIKDDFKIRKGLPTLKYLVKNRAAVMIVTHLGRPHLKKHEPALSTRPLALRLSRLLQYKVKHVSDLDGFAAGNEAAKMKPGSIVMLENIRFFAGEETNDRGLAKSMAGLADYFVNDAFAVSHRSHASVSAIQRYLPAYAGLLLASEIGSLDQVLEPKKPLVIVMGGAKAETKLPLIFRLHKKAERILLGGALANSFLVAKNIEVGRSLCDRASVKFAREFRSAKIMLPIDVVVSGKENGGSPKPKSVHQVSRLDYIYDIGPQTIRFYGHMIKNAATIVWNGPMGLFEREEYKHGTLAIGRLIASRSTGRAFGVAGGGETVEALQKTKMLSYLDWISTGGGAMLAYLGGAKMPGLRGLC